jgi:hypothetical protein
LDILLLLFGNYVDGSSRMSHAVIELELFEYQVSMAIDRDVPNQIEWSHFEFCVVLISRMVESHEPHRINGIYFILATAEIDCKACTPYLVDWNILFSALMENDQGTQANGS